MRIAILTQPLHTNYGGILQAYALQTLLEKNGHRVVVVDREYNFKLPVSLFLLRLASFVKCAIRYYLLGHKDVVLMNPLSPFYRIKENGYKMQRFVKKHIYQSKPIYSSRNLKTFFKRNKFDCYVVGSDQVWRPCYSPCITDFFLKEVPTGNKALKIAYAASFGTDRWEFTEEETKECALLAKEFDVVSVREESGIALCRDYLGIDAEHLLDPTMLLSKEDYINLFEQANVSQSKGNLFCYVLDENVEADLIIRSLKRDGYVPNYASICSRQYQLSVEEWLRGIYDAEFVVTDSFHACVFSILFEKPFVVVGNKSRGNARFESLLKMFVLSDRMVESYNHFLQRKGSLLDNERIILAQNIMKYNRNKSLAFISNKIQ